MPLNFRHGENFDRIQARENMLNGQDSEKSMGTRRHISTLNMAMISKGNGAGRLIKYLHLTARCPN